MEKCRKHDVLVKFYDHCPLCKPELEIESSCSSELLPGVCEICKDAELPTPQSKMCGACYRLVYDENLRLMKDTRRQAKINVARRLAEQRAR